MGRDVSEIAWRVAANTRAAYNRAMRGLRRGHLPCWWYTWLVSLNT
jgi:hypothetical protein